MRCVIYGRVSLEDQMQKYGMQAQLRACRDYAALNGYTVIEEITDDGISGATLDRPGLERVRRLVRDGQVDVVLALDTDRITREFAHWFILKPEIERNAKLEFVAAKFEQTPSGEMFFQLRGVIAQYERANTKERTLRGRKEKARQGYIVGGRVPYGYDYLGKSSGERGRLIVNDQQSAVARMIFAAYDQGATIREIVRRLRADNVQSWGGKLWGTSSVRRILINETFAGVAHYGTHKREGTRLVVRTDGERIPLSVPAIVDRSVWDRVQTRLSENPRVGRPTQRYLLRGLLYCACGRRMGGDPGHGSPCYRCAGRDTLQPTKERCRSKILASRLDSAVWEAVTEPFQNPAKLRRLVSDHIKELASSGESQRTLEMQKQVARLKAREERARRCMLDPEMPNYDELKTEFRKASDELNRVQTELSERVRQERVNGAALNSIDSIVHTIAAVMPSLDQEQRQEFLRRCTERVTWDGTKAEIVCFLAQNGADHQHVVRTSGGNLQRTLGTILTPNVTEVRRQRSLGLCSSRR